MTRIVRTITSTKNARILHCVKLRIKRRYRDACHRCLLIGKEILQELQNSSTVLKTRSVMLTEEQDLHFANQLTQEVFLVSDHVMTKLTGLQSAEAVKIVAEVDLPSWSVNWTSSRVLTLDGIQDPGNLGTLLRACSSFGFQPVLLLPNCCDPFNEKVLRAARGASFTVPIFKLTSAEMPQLLKTKSLYPIGATAHSNDRITSEPMGSDHDGALEDVVRRIQDGRRNVCLFLGSEGQGLTPEIDELCQEHLTIPLCTNMESLNVSVAGGILMYLLRNKV